MELAVAAVFTWLGMVLAISFLEAPLKFRAPGITIPLGLGIGRLVFRALNAAEVVLVVVVAVSLLLDDADRPATRAVVAVGIAGAVLLLQVLAIRPALTKRSDAVLAGTSPADAPRSRAHLWYVGAELVKVVALVLGGSFLLAG